MLSNGTERPSVSGSRRQQTRAKDLGISPIGVDDTGGQVRFDGFCVSRCTPSGVVPVKVDCLAGFV